LAKGHVISFFRYPATCDRAFSILLPRSRLNFEAYARVREPADLSTVDPNRRARSEWDEAAGIGTQGFSRLHDIVNRTGDLPSWKFCDEEQFGSLGRVAGV
jgi:hypothetical protein